MQDILNRNDIPNPEALLGGKLGVFLLGMHGMHTWHTFIMTSSFISFLFPSCSRNSRVLELPICHMCHMSIMSIMSIARARWECNVLSLNGPSQGEDLQPAGRWHLVDGLRLDAGVWRSHFSKKNMIKWSQISCVYIYIWYLHINKIFRDMSILNCLRKI
jgi:hypothetical protein